MAVNHTELEKLMHKMVSEIGAAMNAALVVVGDKLGLYKAVAEADAPLSVKDLAARTGTAERYAREWLAAQAASGYLEYDAASDRCSMTPEQKAVFAAEDSPYFVLGAFDIIAAMHRDEPRITRIFKTGGGLGWHEHDPMLYRGTERFFKPGYRAFLVSQWLPALDGVCEKLERGGRVADVGCGHGVSTILMAKAFPNSSFVGFDYHASSIERAKALASEEGAPSNLRFECASAHDFEGRYDLVTFFDCLHDMGDPVGVGRHVRGTISPDGTWMIVEPYAHDSIGQNLNPLGRIYYAASTMLCVPSSLAQQGGLALGAQAGEAKLRKVVTAAGFSTLQRVAETPFNMVLEARP